MTTLVIAEHEDAALKATTLHTVGAARQLNNGVHCSSQVATHAPLPTPRLQLKASIWSS